MWGECHFCVFLDHRSSIVGILASAGLCVCVGVGGEMGIRRDGIMGKW